MKDGNTERVFDLSSGDKVVLSIELTLRITGLFLDIEYIFNTYLSDITAKRNLSESSLASIRMTLMGVNCL